MKSVPMVQRTRAFGNIVVLIVFVSIVLVLLLSHLSSAFSIRDQSSKALFQQRTSGLCFVQSSQSQQPQKSRQCHHHNPQLSQHVMQDRRRTDRRNVLFMGWGPEPVWSDATIAQSARAACESGKSVVLRVAVPVETAQSYQVPGQYVQIRPAIVMDTTESQDEMPPPPKPLFLAIASAPPSLSSPLSPLPIIEENNSKNAVPSFEFLIKKNAGNDWLTSLPDGATLQISQVLGSGFKIEENINSLKYDFPTQNIVLFAAGSGIAPIAAAIRSAPTILQSNTRTCRLYYGERTAEDLCYIDQYTIWENQCNVQIVPVLSQPDNNNNNPNDEWNGRVGYVQTAFEEDGLSIPRNSAALLCGMKGMTEAVKDLLLKAGVFEGRILFNF